jgi:DNA-binding protein
MPKVLTIAPLERILKKAGAKRVSREAAEEFGNVLEDYIIRLSTEANLLARHAGRKTITEEDVKIARKKFGL